jgi:hypothetical protein
VQLFGRAFFVFYRTQHYIARFLRRKKWDAYSFSLDQIFHINGGNLTSLITCDFSARISAFR